MKRAVATLVVALIVTALPGHALAASSQDTEQRLEQLQQEMRHLKEKIDAQKGGQSGQPPAPAAATATPAAQPQEGYRPLGEAVRLGGYGSVRFETNSLDDAPNTFTFRRFVLTGDARIADPLRFVFEVELERFTQLEVERTTGPADGGLAVRQAIEGSSETELSLEQAWLEYALAPALRYRAGMLLVPLGRFNLTHDDNRWNLPRRTLIDRGVPVLPVKAAWPEVGMGFAGDVPLRRAGSLNYHVYVVNGVTLDSEVEQLAQTREGDTTKLEVEAELRPARGTANVDLKNAKAVTGRLAWSPLPGQELGGSFYLGRYTPDFLAAERLMSFGADGLFTLGHLEAEAEYLYTHFDNVGGVASSFARVARDKESEAEGVAAGPGVETEVEFELAGLATKKQGYWVELRYRLFPDWLKGSVLGRHFENPQLVPTVRWEQAWLSDLVREVEFSGATLTDLVRQNRRINRITAGLAYRPVPLVAFQAAFEYTWTGDGSSLAEVTNFLPAKEAEDVARAFLFGVAFGF